MMFNHQTEIESAMARLERAGNHKCQIPETRNPKPETRNPKPETRNPKNQYVNTTPPS
jgi:hypothetical protein